MANPLDWFKQKVGPKQTGPTKEQIKAAGDQIKEIVQALPAYPNLGYSRSLADQVYSLIDQYQRILFDEAEERAAWLLDRHLTNQQRDELRRSGQIKVKGQAITYRINRLGGVFVDDGPNPAINNAYLCIAPKVALPDGDRMLSIKLMIEGAEGEFLKIANLDSNYDLHLKPDGTTNRPYQRNDGLTAGLFGAVDQTRFLQDQLTFNENYFRNRLATATTTVTNTQGTVLPPGATVTNGHLHVQPRTVDVTTFGDTTRTFLTDITYTGE